MLLWPQAESEGRGVRCRVTGKGYMDVNRISGYIPGKIVFFLMQARIASPLGFLGNSLA